MIGESDARSLSPLSPEQQAAITAAGGPVLVTGGPGTGKSRVLSLRIAHLIEARHVSPDQIIALTFTRAVAEQMRRRMSLELGGPLADGVVVATFHAFGARLLNENSGIVADRLGLLPNFLIYDEADQHDLVKRAIQEIFLDPKQFAPRRVLSRISAAKSVLISPEECADEAETDDDEVVARAYAAYQRLLRKANAVDFDDLLALPIQLFDAAPGVLQQYQDRFRYVFVDSFQDTNRVQYVLVTALAAKHRNLFVVGDPDQSIYGWRQADIRNILDFEKDYPDARRIHLELNYRSTQRIVEAADRVIRANTQRIDRRLRTSNDEGEPVVVTELADGAHEAQFIVSEIQRLIKTESISPGHVAVMYRTTAQSRVLEQAFRVSDIPYRIVGGVRFYDRKEVKDVLAVFRLLHNPADAVSLERVLDSFPIARGIGPRALDGLRDWASLSGVGLLDSFLALARGAPMGISPPALTGAARSGAERVGTAFALLRERAGKIPLTDLLDAVVDLTRYEDSFDREVEEQMQQWANVLALRSDLAKFDPLEPEEALATYLEHVSLSDDAALVGDGGPNLVTLTPIHSAQGLEFPVVFIAGIEEGLLPISRAIEIERSDPLPVEEERRIFYVGITRAQRKLYLTYAIGRLSYGSLQPGLPSRFLGDLPQEGTRRIRPRSAGHRSRPGGLARSAMRLPAAPQPTANPPTYAAGQRVFHDKFGEGTVVEVTARSDDQEVAVDFVGRGRKRLMASFARLEIIE